MKRILVCIALMSLQFGNKANAQSIEISMNGGIVTNTPPQSEGLMNNRQGIITPTLSFNIMGNVSKHWQVGASVGLLALNYKTNTYYPLYFEDRFLPPGDIAPQVLSSEYYLSDLANPAIPVQLVVNYKMSYKKLNFYSGVSAGYFFAPGYRYYYSQYYHGDYPVTGGGLVAGMQFGGTWQFSKVVGINMGMAMSYYEPYKVLAVPATAGLKFSF